MTPSVDGQEVAGQRLGVGIDQPGLAVEPVAAARDRTGRRPESDRAGRRSTPGTKMLQMSPQRSVSRVELDDLGRLAVVHACRRAAAASPSPLRLKTTNCTPFSWRIAPYGSMCVNWRVGWTCRMSMGRASTDCGEGRRTVSSSEFQVPSCGTGLADVSLNLELETCNLELAAKT